MLNIEKGMGTGRYEEKERAHEEANKENERRDDIEPLKNIFREDIAEKFDEGEQEKIDNALELMIKLHADQKDRPDGKSYISHPLEIASDVIKKQETEDSDIAIGALLHDAVEDKAAKLVVLRKLRKGNEEFSKEESTLNYDGGIEEVALREIEELYGERVKSIVESLSNPDFDALKREAEERGETVTKNELYKSHIQEAVQNPDVRAIKYADFARNALAIENLDAGAKKEKLKKKYGPVITEVFIPLFRQEMGNLKEEVEDLKNKENSLTEEEGLLLEEKEKKLKASEENVREMQMKFIEEYKNEGEKAITEKDKSYMEQTLGSRLHDDWRAPRRLEGGDYAPRIKVLVEKKDGSQKWVNESDLGKFEGAEEIDRQDIANTDFENLADQIQKENRVAGEFAMGLVLNAVENNLRMDSEKFAAKIHDAWAERNPENAELGKPYEELTEEEKIKDRDHLVAAIEVYNQWLELSGQEN